ncbi:polymorphic toxin-type HINT domain-containing protein [Streptomyces humidus]|uniref:polymorphic toxin-type HINT domain-containing protein n=1 Tax=Streptomyces humidus TaxID=52259 RepID=UPI00331E9F63
MELSLNPTTKAVTATRYYTFGGATVAMRTTAGIQFLAADQHGTAEIAVNATTGGITRRRMDPYGNERGNDGKSWVNDKGFLGKTVDESTGLVNVGAREYDRSTGRFISVDPIIDHNDPQQMNGYAYANSNPVSGSDASGLFCDGCSVDNPGTAWTAANGPGCTTEGCYDHGGKLLYRTNGQSAAEERAAAARAKASKAKQRAADIAMELADIAMEELGIKDALDCFTTGNLGACGATVFNVASSFAGGLIGKLGKKYGLPWKWDKAAALGKRIWGLVNKLGNAVKDWFKSSKLAKRAEEAAESAAEAAASCPVPNSFVPEQKVLMADGGVKAIKDVKVGDKVVATDPETGKTEIQTVTAEIKGTGAKHLVKVTIDTDGAKGSKTASITATDGHPFWVPELRDWIDATDLKPGEWLRTSAGTLVQITAVQRWNQQSTVYNLTVSDLHTYYVAAAATPVLVHNCPPGGFLGKIFGGGKKNAVQQADEAMRAQRVPVKLGDLEGVELPDLGDAQKAGYLRSMSDDHLLEAINNPDDIGGSVVIDGGAVVNGNHRLAEAFSRINDPHSPGITRDTEVLVIR